MKAFIYSVIALLTFAACEKDEIPIEPRHRGNAITAELPTTIYGHQSYFDFESNSFVQTNEKTDWDIAFGCGEFSPIIYVNTAKLTATAKVENSSFEAVTATENLEFNYDSSTGFYDSLLITNWTENTIYVLDLGYTEAGDHLGYRKIRIIENTPTHCHFQYGQVNATIPTNATLEKDDNYNAVFYSILNEKAVTIEPEKSKWDIAFTQYIYYFHEFETPYLVTGIIMNRTNTKAYQHESNSFSDINFDQINIDLFSYSLDVIGYEWKEFLNNIYVVYTDHNFIIQTQEGYYYKLHFVDFYNQSGAKGYPVFEFQEL
ncbi:MAG: HmuY family protein [Putridiphycobacter sp.]|nr:HmuY family protein [Putridiphycobacter sp.]